MFIRERIRTSRNDFAYRVWPLWAEHLEGKSIIPVEGRTDELSRRLDAWGVDAYLVLRQTGGMIPVASRIEYKEHAPRFTLRYRVFNHKEQRESSDCEFSRKSAALDDAMSRQYLPLYTIQSLILGDSTVHSCLIKTVDLIEFARRNEEDLPIGGFPNRYLVIPLDRLAKAGVPFVVKHAHSADTRD